MDLSAGMLEQARALGVYDHLFAADAVEHLRAATEMRHDLVLAADVFIYVGDLEPLFGAVRAALVPGGMFCFTAEPAPVEDDFRLLPSLRYAHSERYLRSLAERHGFDTVEIAAAPLREDQRVPLGGLYVLLRSRR